MRNTLVLLVIIFFNLSYTFAGNIKGTVKTADGVLENAVIYIEKIEGKTFTSTKETCYSGSD